MPRDFLAGIQPRYDVIVIGSGLAGMTAANLLARQGRSVLLLEQHYKLGGMATWFRRPGGHIFDISLHGFPAWHDQELPPLLEPGDRGLHRARYGTCGSITPCFRLTTTYDRDDFTRILTAQFGIPRRPP